MQLPSFQGSEKKFSHLLHRPPPMTDAVLLLNTHGRVHAIEAVGLKACRDGKSWKVVSSERFCDDALAGSFEEVFRAACFDEAETADEACALIFLRTHAPQEVTDPFLIARFRTCSPATGEDTKFILESVDDDARIVCEGRQIAGTEEVPRLDERILSKRCSCFSYISFEMKIFRSYKLNGEI